MNTGEWGRRLAKRLLTGAVSASARFTAAVIGRWHADVPERTVRGIFSARGFHFTPSTSPSGGGKQSGSEAGYPSRSQSSHAPKEVIYDNGVLNKS